jgi:hypothetical protein
MPDAVHRGISAGAFALALLACASASAQQGEPIGSWWLVDTSSGGAPRHAIMTLSTQGSGVIAIQCAAGKSTVLLGLNKPELRPSSGPILAVDYQIGAAERQRGSAVLISEDTIELDERASDEIVTRAAEAASFSIHLPEARETEATLMFRPVETEQAIKRLREACAKAGPAR